MQCQFLNVVPNANGNDVQTDCLNEAVYLMDDIPACQRCHDDLVAAEGQDYFEIVPLTQGGVPR